MRSIAIIGSSDLGMLVAQLALDCGWDVAGFIDNKKEKGTKVGDFGPVIGNVDEVHSMFAARAFSALAIGVGYLQFEYRRSVYERFDGQIAFPPLIHPSSFVHATCEMGDGAIVLAGCTIDVGSAIGANVLLNTGVAVAHHSTIGAHSFVGPAAAIAGKVTVGESCFIGINSTIIDHRQLCSGTKLGAASLLTQDTSEPGWYLGAPARLRDQVDG